jgi:hypothetical protein
MGLTMRTSRIGKIGAGVAFLTLAATGVAIGAGSVHAADPYTDENLLKECRGEDTIPNISVSCEYRVDTVKNENEMIWTAIGSIYLDNCDTDAESILGAEGTYTRSRSWTVGGQAGLEFGSGLSIAGGGSYGEAEESGHAIQGQWTVPGRTKAQAIYGQPHEVSDGTMLIEGHEVVGETLMRDWFEVKVTDMKIPRWDIKTKSAFKSEQVPCNEEFKTPEGPAEAFRGSVQP